MSRDPVICVLTVSDISAIPEDDIQPPGALQEDVTDSGIPTTTLNAEEEQPKDCVPVRDRAEGVICGRWSSLLPGSCDSPRSDFP